MGTYKIGFSLPLAGSLRENLKLAREAESFGYTDAWVADVGGADPFVVAALVGEQCPRLRLGTAVVNVYTRSAPVLAATAGTVSTLLGPGRFVLGLGSSSPVMVEQWSGMPFEHPLGRVRETVSVLHQAFAGEKTSFDGTIVRSHGFRQADYLPVAPQVWLAVQRPRMGELAGEVADGAVTNFTPVKALGRLIDNIKRSADKAGKPHDLEVAARIQTLVTDDKAAAYDMFRARLGPYLATPIYNPFLVWCGYEDVAQAIRKGWQNRDRAAVAEAITEDLIDDLVILGDAAECHDRLQRFVEAGITVPVINPIAPTSEGALEILRALPSGS